VSDPRPRKVRRALTHVGGAITTEGDPRLAAKLAAGLEVSPVTDEEGRDPVRTHVHGFHAYPARMHPETAARLVRAFVPPGGTVLDPFCGSGTVLVEALIAGRHAVGTDLNPLAVRLARLKTRHTDEAARAAILAAAVKVAQHADARREARMGATQRLAPEDVEAFDPHVLLELDGLRDGIRTVEDLALREVLLLVLSSILVKLSRKASDTASYAAPRRIAAGFPARLFVRKTEELGRRLAAFEAARHDAPTGEHGPPREGVRIGVDDAKRLATVAPRSIDAVITSPPYVATYDYVAHHALRLRWLGIDPSPFVRGEMGARRHYARLHPREATRSWVAELSAVLRAVHRVVRPDAPVVLLMADSAVGGEPLRADALVAEAARASAFRCVARASQARPHFHGPTSAAFRRAPRAEHALLLEPVAVSHGPKAR
jgi:DNA modification methylase